MKKVFILKNFKNKDIFVSPMTPKYFTSRTEANYARVFMQIPEYTVIEVEVLCDSQAN